MKKQLATAIGVLIALSSVLLVYLPHVPSVLAQYSWTDTINIYNDVSAVYTDIRRITNNETVSVDVRVYITFTEKIHLLDYYRLSANGTDFIIISGGEITLFNGAYYRLEPGQTLYFSVEAKGASSLSIDDVVKVEVRVEFWSSILGDVTGPEDVPDGIVDIYDLTFIDEAYGDREGDSSWDEHSIADITGPDSVPDGIIDIYDVATCGKNYGKSQPW